MTDTKGERILIVDDEETNIYAMKIMMNNMGGILYEYTFDGKPAIKKIMEQE